MATSGGHEKSSFLTPVLFIPSWWGRYSSRSKSIFLRQPSLVRLPQSDVFILFYGLWHSRIKAVQLKNKQFYNYSLHCDVINIIKGLRHIKNTQSVQWWAEERWGRASQLWTCVQQHFLVGSLLLLLSCLQPPSDLTGASSLLAFISEHQRDPSSPPPS